MRHWIVAIASAAIVFGLLLPSVAAAGQPEVCSHWNGATIHPDNLSKIDVRCQYETEELENGFLVVRLVDDAEDPALKADLARIRAELAAEKLRIIGDGILKDSMSRLELNMPANASPSYRDLIMVLRVLVDRELQRSEMEANP